MKKKRQEDKVLQKAQKMEGLGQISARIRINEVWFVKNCTTVRVALIHLLWVIGKKVCHQCASTICPL